MLLVLAKSLLIGCQLLCSTYSLNSYFGRCFLEGINEFHQQFGDACHLKTLCSVPHAHLHLWILASGSGSPVLQWPWSSKKFNDNAQLDFNNTLAKNLDFCRTRLCSYLEFLWTRIWEDKFAIMPSFDS